MNKIKILFLAANPLKKSQLQLDEEFRQINEKIQLSEHHDKFELFSAWAVRITDIYYSFNRYKPHIVHFSGHGTKSGEIMLIDHDGRSTTFTPESIKTIFSELTENINIVSSWIR